MPTYIQPPTPRPILQDNLVGHLAQMYLEGEERNREQARRDRLDEMARMDRDRQFGLQQEQARRAAEEFTRQKQVEDEGRALDLAKAEQASRALTNAPMVEQPMPEGQAGPPELAAQPSEPIAVPLRDRILKLAAPYQDEIQAQNLAKLRDTLRIQREQDRNLVTNPEILKQFGLTSPVDESNINSLIAERGRRDAAAQAARIHELTRTGMDETRGDNRLMTILNKFQADPIMKQAYAGATMNQLADQVIRDPNSATNQLSSLYILVKNLDPDSAVREGEIQLANATQSYLQTWKNELARIGSGRVIDPQAAVALAQATKQIAGMWNERARTRSTQYQAQSDEMGVGDRFKSYLGRFQSPSSGGGATGSDAPWTKVSPTTRIRRIR